MGMQNNHALNVLGRYTEMNQRRDCFTQFLTSEHNLLAELQRQFIVDKNFSRKEVAAKMGCSEATLARWINGQCDIPAKKLPRLYYAMSNHLGLFSALLQGTDLSIIRHTSKTKRRPIMALLADLTMRFGSLYDLVGKLNRGEPLTWEEQQRLEEQVNLAKQDLDEVLEVARARKEEQD